MRGRAGVVAFFVYILALLTARPHVASAGGAPASNPPIHSAATRIVFVLRHAEKAAEPAGDPDLTEEGTARARELARFLSQCHIDRLFCTETRRARATLAPLAEETSLPIETYNIDDPFGTAQVVLASGAAASVVVAHGDTVVPIIEGLGVLRHPDFGAIEYDDLFLVTIPATGPVVLRLKYGKAVAKAPAPDRSTPADERSRPPNRQR